jgi:hypothetical protein
MKFKAGDKIDVQHCKALQQQLLRCHDAFLDFTAIATRTITAGEDRFTAYRMYNAYARFLHHLYEISWQARWRETFATPALPNQTRRCAKPSRNTSWGTPRVSCRTSVGRLRTLKCQNGTGSRDVADFCSPEFAKSFREHRNVAVGHVNYARAGLSLHGFHQRYHVYMFLLYRDAYSWWGRIGGQIPDLDEITKFSVLVRQQPPALLVD